MKQLIFTLAFSFFFASLVTAQISQNISPYSFNKQFVIDDVPPVSLPGIKIDEVLEEDEKAINSSRFAAPMSVNFNLNNSGTWYDLPNGDRVWILRVEAVGALSLNVLYQNFFLPEGATFHLYNASKTEVLGAYTSANNKETRRFATDLIKDDNLTFEYYEPVNQKGNGIIEINRINYGYRSLSQESPDEMREKSAWNFGNSAACNINVNCPEGNNWQTEKKGVARILVNTNAGSGWCSGSMIGNTSGDGTQYFLTADHCVGVNIADYSQWIFYFNFEAPTCPNPATAPASNSVTGSTLKSRNAATDFLLLEISTAIPVSYGVYYNGWDRTNNVPSATTGIHHPAGDIKKISLDTDSPTTSAYSGSPGSGTTHWRCVWDSGTTQGGSSGSALFDSSKRIVGQLHGGAASCTNLTGPDYYGKFALSWDGAGTNSTRLSNWLDSAGSGDMTVNGYTPTAPVPTCNQVTTPANGSSNIPNNTAISWAVNTQATGYKLQIGTTAGGSDLLALTDVGNVLTYQPANFNFSTTYHVTLIPYNATGQPSSCTSTSFTTGTDLNHGGGAGGTDPNQPNSGGYYFANSSASGSTLSAPTYNWIDPVAGAHTEVTNSWTTGSNDDGYFLIPDIGFDFPFWGTNYRMGNAAFNSNGMVSFAAATPGAGTGFSIPSSADAISNYIAACITDLNATANSKYYYHSNASRFVITWWHVADYNAPTEYITFQVILYPSGLIIVQYNDAESNADDGASNQILNGALVGIENGTGTKGIQYRNNGIGAPMFSSPMAVAFGPSSVLPVDLSEFTATEKGEANVLDWQTLTERNNSYFEVERSTNGSDFASIGRVNGNGSSNETLDYSYTDANPPTTAYYRLQQVDYDGSFAYSEVRLVKREGDINNSAVLYPIPVTDELTIDFTAMTDTDINITVNDALGQSVLSRQVQAVRGENQSVLDFSSLPAGTYFVRLQGNDKNSIHTVIKN